MFTNEDVLAIAMKQSALDINCQTEDFIKEENVIVRCKIGPLARKYYKEPIACDLVSYGNNIVASVKEEYRELVKAYIEKFKIYHCFETPNMHVLDDAMQGYRQRVCFMAEFFCRM